MNTDASADLDDIFVEIGKFGPHQMLTVLILTILNISTAATFTIYIISSNTLEYR